MSKERTPMSHRSSRGFGSRKTAVHGCIHIAQAVTRNVSVSFQVRAEAVEGPHPLFFWVHVNVCECSVREKPTSNIHMTVDVTKRLHVR